MSTRDLIENRLQSHFAPVFLKVEDESHLHAGHAGARGGGGHFRVTLVTSQFEGKNLVAQHRMVYGLFEEELKQSIHALALQTFTPQAWESRRG